MGRMRVDGCQPWRESLGAFALAHLDELTRIRVQAHLDGCARCRAEFTSLRAVAGVLPLAEITIHAEPLTRKEPGR